MRANSIHPAYVGLLSLRLESFELRPVVTDYAWQHPSARGTVCQKANALEVLQAVGTIVSCGSAATLLHPDMELAFAGDVFSRGYVGAGAPHHT